MFKKLVLLAAAAMTALCLLPQSLSAQGKKDSVVMAMTLEPPGLDPTSGAAAAIAEVTLYNVYETLTKVREDGSVLPLLAESFETAPDLKTYTFKLRKGVTFQNGEPFNAEAVKFSYERAAASTSTNKDKSLFQSIAQITTPGDDTVVINMKNPEPNLPFLLGQASASIVEPKSAPTDATVPVGTGPYVLAAWASTRPLPSLRVRYPCRAARATENPFSTPRSSCTRLCAHASTSKSRAGTAIRPTPARPYSRPSDTCPMSAQIATPPRPSPGRKPGAPPGVTASSTPGTGYRLW